MTRRRRMLIGFSIACCFSALLAGLFLFMGGERPDLQLVFVGYTNVPVEVSQKGSSDRYTVWFSKALVAVTNCGVVPVRIAPIWQAYPGSQIPPHIGQSYLMTPASVVEVGKSEIGNVYYPVKESQWRATIAYTRCGWVERINERARNTRNIVVRGLTSVIPTSPKLHWVQSDWITNSPWPATVSRYHITAPPPDVSIELPPRPSRQ